MNCRFQSLTTLAWLLIVVVNLITWGWNLEKPAWSNELDSTTNANKSEQFRDVFSRAELVILGTVVGIRNYLPTDGGYGYEIAASETLKGKRADKYSVRSVGWTYTIPFNEEERVLLFLNSSNSLLIKESFLVALDHEHKPLAFRLDGDRLIGVSVPPNSRSSLARYSLKQIRQAIR